jgi:hypothetical protein
MVNRMSIPYFQSILRGSLLTVITLFGGLTLGLVSGAVLFHILPESNVIHPSLLHMTIAAIPALFGFLLGGAAWGTSMSKLAGKPSSRRLAWAGMLGFAPITMALAVGLSVVEGMSSRGFMAQIPTHRLFTILFVPAAFLIAGTSAWAIGMGLKEHYLAKWFFLRVGLASAGTFLAINLIMESSGWVVGGPGAAERTTMITVLVLGNLGAALVGGGVMGWRFHMG